MRDKPRGGMRQKAKKKGNNNGQEARDSDKKVASKAASKC